MKSLRDEIPLRGVAKRRERNEWQRGALSERERDRAAARQDTADLISSEAVRRRFHPNFVRISSCEARFHYFFFFFLFINTTTPTPTAATAAVIAIGKT